jgi:hypothetical protein
MSYQEVDCKNDAAPIKIAPGRIDANALKVPVNYALLALTVDNDSLT